MVIAARDYRWLSQVRSATTAPSPRITSPIQPSSPRHGRSSELPRFAMLSLWVVLARAFGDTDGGRVRLLVGMVLWSLPEAVVLRLLGESGLFFGAWCVVLVGLYLPRLALRSLRPGVFS